MAQEFLRVNEVAEVLGVDRHTVYRHARAGRLPAVRLGRLWLFPRKAIEEYGQLRSGGEVQLGTQSPSLQDACRRAAELLRGADTEVDEMFAAIATARTSTEFADCIGDDD